MTYKVKSNIMSNSSKRKSNIFQEPRLIVKGQKITTKHKQPLL